MEGTVLDVLMYLFETFADGDYEPEPDRDELRAELERAGFGGREIDRALDWLEGLNASEVTAAPQSSAIRIFDRVEQQRLDAGARGYLLQLKQIGILGPVQRELVIDRLLALDSEEVDVEQVRWVVMMVLFSQPDRQDAFTQMENLVFADEPVWLH